jgi:hypothetical protein
LLTTRDSSEALSSVGKGVSTAPCHGITVVITLCRERVIPLGWKYESVTGTTLPEQNIHHDSVREKCGMAWMCRERIDILMKFERVGLSRSYHQEYVLGTLNKF